MEGIRENINIYKTLRPAARQAHDLLSIAILNSDFPILVSDRQFRPPG